MKKNNLFIKTFIYVLMSLCLLKEVRATHLYLLSNHSNAGEHNQVLGVKGALEKLSPQLIVVDVNLGQVAPDQVADQLRQVVSQSKDKVIVVGAGESGAECIKKCPTHPNLTVCLMSHMVLKAHKDPEVLQKVTFVALPAHAIPPQMREDLGPKIIETIGVSHNRQRKDAEAVYAEWGEKYLPKAGPYLVVILGGDAPPPGSKINKFFGPKDAEQLAAYVVKQKQPDDVVVVLNGPRTGKFKPDQQEDLTVHRQGRSDPITELFVTHLKNQGVECRVFDFQHKTPENESHVLPFNSFDLAVGAVLSKGRLILVPGESTSMISEARDLLSSEKVRVYENGAMSDVHQAHVQSELGAGKIVVLRGYSEEDFPQEVQTKEPSSSAADTIAQRLVVLSKTN